MRERDTTKRVIDRMKVDLSLFLIFTLRSLRRYESRNSVLHSHWFLTFYLSRSCLLVLNLRDTLTAEAMKNFFAKEKKPVFYDSYCSATNVWQSHSFNSVACKIYIYFWYLFLILIFLFRHRNILKLVLFLELKCFIYEKKKKLIFMI